jgi:gas vesicle protein
MEAILMEKRNIFENSASFLARKSGQVLNIGKLKLNIANLENDMYNLKAELGDMIYNSFKAGSDCSEQVKELCEKLEQMDQQLQDMKKEIEETKNQI